MGKLQEFLMCSVHKQSFKDMSMQKLKEHHTLEMLLIGHHTQLAEPHMLVIKLHNLDTQGKNNSKVEVHKQAMLKLEEGCMPARFMEEGCRLAM